MPSKLSFRLRMTVMVVGYLVMMLGAVSTFRVPFFVSLLLVIGGSVIVMFGSRDVPPMSGRSWIFLILGMVMVLGVLSFFGEARLRQAPIYPGSYIVIWVLGFHTVRNLRHALTRREPNTPELVS